MPKRPEKQGLVFDIIPANYEDSFEFEVQSSESNLEVQADASDGLEQDVRIIRPKNEAISPIVELELQADEGRRSFADVVVVKNSSSYAIDDKNKISHELEAELASDNLGLHNLSRFGAVPYFNPEIATKSILSGKKLNKSENIASRNIRPRRSIEFERSINAQAPIDDSDVEIPTAQLVAEVNPYPVNNLAVHANENVTKDNFIPQFKPVSQINRQDQKKSPTGSGIGKWGASVIMLVIVFIMVFWIGLRQGLFIKKNIIQNGQNALHNFEDAKVSLESFKFNQAASAFTLAYSDLEKAAYNFGPVGAQISKIFSNLPFVSDAHSANSVIEVGLAISKSGEYLSKAMDTISHIDFGQYMDVSVKHDRSLGGVAKEFKEIIGFAKTNIDKSKALLSDVDLDMLDGDKKALIEKLQSKIPTIMDYTDKAVALADFVYGLIGEKGERTYMVIFQNNTELRATGGFIGSYALLTFKDGNLVKIFVDDIYNPDGQLKEKIIPPKPMQHITPTSGTRDANWFPDFPKSASRIVDFYKKSVGVDVDGIISITPDVFTDILKLVGPIEMANYGRTITADNFVAEVQDEIEYGDNRHQPKTILKDLQPILLSKIKQLPKEKYADIVNVLIRRVEDKHILAYFKNSKLQDFVIEHHVAGEIRNVADGGDYVSVVLTNIKGSKSDAVTMNNYTLDVFGDSGRHELTLSRKHNGGDAQLGFYNRQNPAYVRVYLPKNAKFKSIEGNDAPGFKPLIKYDTSFIPDKDVSSAEASMTHPQTEVDVWHENEKLVIGFWMIVNPKSIKEIKLIYDLDMPKLKIGDQDNSYKILWQKQSGIKNSTIDFRYHLSGADKFISADKDVRVKDNVVIFSAPQNQDHELEVRMKY